MRHIVEFEWCKTCKNWKKDEDDEPCCDCLAEPVKDDGKKPVYYVEDKSKTEKPKATPRRRERTNG